jgi:hypothetical protein
MTETPVYFGQLEVGDYFLMARGTLPRDVGTLLKLGEGIAKYKWDKDVNRFQLGDTYPIIPTGEKCFETVIKHGRDKYRREMMAKLRAERHAKAFLRITNRG